MNKNLKINILLYNPSLGGGDRVVSTYAKYLKARGHTVCVTALKPPDIKFQEKILHFIRTRVIPKPGFSTTLYDNAGVELKVIDGWDSLTNEHLPDADIVISTLWVTAEWATALDDSKGVKSYLVQGHEIFPHFPKDRVEATYRAPLQKIVVSKWLEKIMRDKYGSPAVARVLNAVDADRLHTPPRPRNEEPCIGFVYSDGWVKGVEFTTAAILKIQKRFPNLKIVSFGASSPNSRVPLPPNCDFHYKPSQEKIRDIYGQCDLWLCSSRQEGFGLPMVEAMACRCPVVTTAVGAAEDFIENSVQGYIVPVEDSDALAEKAITILEASDGEWRQMSDAAYETATRYTWDDAGALFESALYKIVENAERKTDARYPENQP